MTKFVKSAGSLCPCCDSSDIEGYSFDVRGANAVQDYNCLACSAQWQTVYELKEIMNYSAGDLPSV